MNFMDAIKAGFSNYVTFSGRASRSEYWYWVLFVILASIALSVVDSIVFPSSAMQPLSSLWGLATFIPGLSIMFRRLHDTDHTGWWWLIGLTVIGLFVLLYWAIIKVTPGPNRYGADPVPGTV